ncbi:MAG: succinate dehydrogenase [Burkholderiales bacterium]|nr:succinate dehydrogenase [Burkholderiales bacterium]
MSAAREAKLWFWQRASAVVLAVCVLVHIGVMIYAVRGGLSAAEILGRTRGSLGFAAFYTVFVLGCVVHVPIGLARVCEEWLGLNRFLAVTVAKLATVAILFLGLRAVYGVYAA